VAIIILAGISQAGMKRTTVDDANCLGMARKTRRMTRTTMGKSISTGSFKYWSIAVAPAKASTLVVTVSVHCK